MYGNLGLGHFQRFYYQTLPYFVPFFIISIATGIWGLQITFRMISKYLPDHKIMHKYFAVQFVLVLYKFQPILIKFGWFFLDALFGLRLPSKILENGNFTIL